ncbi:hypothetical protein P872_14145 [Rhodonellum psychrophilum GCM71 = DSM 17998]|uniref:FAD-binding PCMH-type domain-containing protein n=2 Tax=Rhodonellum TaxID=336827 RepID=U5BQM8_9BACT|nr:MULTISPECIES: D-arabinono-1,4-lactone oxidase [Rhodonellum]ERM80213.1 hypothetical protein P872_14145 [Rhodonellum psychrophilum GCM71 = DSM 17998]SDY62032.1 xylitol oxidase [Rhodonellum ikkaensis]
MKRKTFLKLSSTLVAIPLISPMKIWANSENLKNWAGNLTYSTDKVAYPNAVGDIQQFVRKQKKLKVLGTRHCFNTIADSKDFLLATGKMEKSIDIDVEAKQVTVDGGINYGTLAPILQENGFALHNLASLPHISVVGGCMTATHGSGVNNGNLSSQVAALELVAADGEIHQLSREKDGGEFHGAVVGLGALGIVTKITLYLQPTFNIRQFVYENLPMSQLLDNFDAIMSAAYSVSLFTDWQGEFVNEVWVKALENDPVDYGKIPEFFGGKAATKNLHPIAEISAENCSEQMGVSGAWFERLPHFRMGFTPSSGKELQSEYFVPKADAVEAIQSVSRLAKQVGPHLLISEIRSIKADKLWMSPCYAQDSVAIHFTWKQEIPEVMRLLPIIEKELMPFNVKPHWGKLFAMAPPVLQNRYERLADFKNLVAKYDPQGKFRNAFLEKNLYGL